MKISRRNFLKVLGSATMAGALAACGGSSSTSAAVSGAASTAAAAAPGTTYTMNIGSVMSASHPSIVALQSFEKAVEERTNGGIQVEIYTDSALGGESDLIEQVRGGSTEACMQMGAANFEGINAEVNVALLPFLFTSLENARNAWGGDFGAQFAEKLIEPMGFKVLSIWESGYRHMTNNTRPLEKPEDLKGIKFRTTTSDLRLAVFEALGAQPVSMSFSEVFTGLQQNVIDGQESPLSTIDSSSFAEVQKYLSLTGHFWTNECLLINEKLWESLPEEWQTILQEEVDACETRIREKNVQSDEELVAKLESEGMEVNEVDKAAFAEQLQPLYDEWEGKVIGSDLMNAYREYSGY